MLKKARFEELKIGMKVKPYPNYELWYKISNIQDDKVYYKYEKEINGYYATKNQLKSGDVEMWYENNQMTLF